MNKKTKVLIAGAGPVGLTAALLLGSKGIPVVVLEAQDAISEELRASTFHPPTLDMMAPYGVTARMMEAGLLCPTWQIRLHPSGDRAVFDLSVLKDESDHPYRLQCEQSKYCHFVLDAVRKLPSVEIRFNTAVAALDQSSDAVTVTASSPDGEQRFSADYVVGADGARSAVRRAIDVDLSGDIYPETTILATTLYPFHEKLEGLSNVSYCWKPDGTFSLLRLPGVWRVSLYARDGQTPEQALEDDAQQSLLHDIIPDAGRIEVLETRPYRIHKRLASTYRKGRVLLAGDAAHLNSPSGGMGMNGGIHDAFSLTEKLIAVLQDGADDSLLDRYERQRRPIAEEEIIQQAHRNRTRMQERDPARRRAMLEDMQRMIDDPVKLKAYLMKSSMIDGLRRAAATV
ncbi:FAD-dependent oxidoreductase [Rhodoplanes sp. Z2-YC6860]|uniref:FAD-dependent oxidoreductase n=1 Tax=Rhodoplanes sp. Z2-YC6860 TaxID=674703 RepID=UPI00078D2973|nr:FAD-dependent monooxygenase [Rhodoplanes sp. Z2-YC6860]AMN45296.1 FAD binding domain protein [Rhodoplanes sp. Z2-YC6860]